MKVVVIAEVELEAENTESACKTVRDVLSHSVYGVESKAKAWVKPDGMDRNPKWDPKPGDLITKPKMKGDIIREVRRVEAGMVQYVSDGKSRVCRISTWLNWAYNATVMEREEDSDIKTEKGDGVSMVQVRERGVVPLVSESPVLPETR